MFTLIEYIHRNPPVKNKSGVYVTKIAEIYQHNYISLNWLIHEEKMDMCRVQLKDSNFLIYFVLFRNCNTKWILHVFNAEILS